MVNDLIECLESFPEINDSSQIIFYYIESLSVYLRVLVQTPFPVPRRCRGNPSGEEYITRYVFERLGTGNLKIPFEIRIRTN